MIRCGPEVAQIENPKYLAALQSLQVRFDLHACISGRSLHVYAFINGNIHLFILCVYITGCGSGVAQNENPESLRSTIITGELQSLLKYRDDCYMCEHR